MPEKKFKFKLGSDPEFSFVLQGRRVSASQLLQNNLKRKKGFKQENKGYSCVGGEIGWDGCDATAELRPSPSNSLAEITSNIKALLTETHKQLPIFDMSVLSTFAPVGGHIHFEIDKTMHDSPQRIQILHKKISSFFLPIMISENKINLRLRSGNNNHAYGTLTDFHGDNCYEKEDGTTEYTYEFRTPSAEWLITEKICNATFAYMGMIYNEVMYKQKNFAKYMSIVYKNNEQAKALHQLAITDYVGITEGLFNNIKKAVRTFELYPEFKEQIEYILNPKRVAEDKKKAKYNIIEGWKLGKTSEFKKPSVKTIINDKKFKESASKIDLDQMVSLMNISYNDDTNVDLFVRSLSERAMAFNWKLKNNYFIFGMKKGINETIVFNQAEELLLGKNLIKTTSDKTAMVELMQRMFSKFQKTQNKTINPITGEIEKINLITIGLPYEMRLKKNPKEFIKLVYALEENKLVKEKIETLHKDLLNDNNFPNDKRGNLFKYAHGLEITEEKEELKGITFDDYSQGHQIAQDNTQRILNQEREDERENTEEPIGLRVPDMDMEFNPYRNPSETIRAMRIGNFNPNDPFISPEGQIVGTNFR